MRIDLLAGIIGVSITILIGIVVCQHVASVATYVNHMQSFCMNKEGINYWCPPDNNAMCLEREEINCTAVNTAREKGWVAIDGIAR